MPPASGSNRRSQNEELSSSVLSAVDRENASTTVGAAIAVTSKAHKGPHRWKRWAKYALSLAILIASIFYAIQGINWEQFLQTLAQVRWAWLLLSGLCTAVAHLIRSQRWRTILTPIAPGTSLLNAFSATMIGYFFNLLIPRSGELLRPYVLSRNEQLPMSSALATVIVERVIDVLSILLLGFFVFLFYQHELQLLFPNFSRNLLNALVIPFVGIVVVLYLLLRTSVMQKILKLTLKRISVTFYHRTLEQLERFKAGFSILRSPRQYLAIIFQTATMWMLYILSLYVLFFAFDFQYATPLTFVDANFLCFVTSIGIAIAPTPGAIGVYHSITKATLHTLYHLSPEAALAYATVAHAVGMYGVALLLGSLSLIREHARGSLWKQRSVKVEKELSDG